MMSKELKEKSPVPFHLQPTVQLVNATLDEVIKGLSMEEEQDGFLTEAERELSIVLEGTLDEPRKPPLRYDGVQITASNLRQTLEPFSQENYGQSIDSRFKGLISDLEYIELLEKGGVGAVNGRISEWLECVKGDVPLEQKTKAMGEVNHILGRAIYLFPHLARGIAVSLKPETEQKTKEFEDKYGWDYYRNRYNMLLEVYQEKKGFPLPETLVLPLPYGFTTGTHGSGERTARASSQEDIYLGFIHPRGDYQTNVPALAVVVKAPLIVEHPTYFTVDEVESIEFTDNGEFTPFVDKRNNENVLVEKTTPEIYYLRFREFSGVRHNLGERMQLRELTDEEWDRCNRELVTARPFTNLWQEVYHTKPRTLKRGFIACVKDDPLYSHHLIMYEITSMRLPKENQEKAAAVLYTNILRGKKSTLSRTVEYKGIEVIRRLTEIPVQGRHF